MIKRILIVTLLYIGVFASSKDDIFFIKSAGIAEEIKVEMTPSISGKTARSFKKEVSSYKTKSGKTFSDDSNLIASFDDEVAIDTFCKRYNLVLKKKLIGRYYLFVNNSGEGILALIQTIVKNEKNIKSVFPDWKLNKKRY